MFSSSVFVPQEEGFHTPRAVYLAFVCDCCNADLEYTGSPLQYPSTAAVDG